MCNHGIKNISIVNTENPSLLDTFIAGRGSIITISGSGFGNQHYSGKIMGYVSFTNADRGGEVSEYLIDKDSKMATSMIDDYDSCDYIGNNNIWSDTLIKMSFPSIIYSNNIINGLPVEIGSGNVTVTNLAQVSSETNYHITVPHSYVMLMGASSTKYPVNLNNPAYFFFRRQLAIHEP